MTRLIKSYMALVGVATLFYILVVLMPMLLQPTYVVSNNDTTTNVLRLKLRNRSRTHNRTFTNFIRIKAAGKGGSERDNTQRTTAGKPAKGASKPNNPAPSGKGANIEQENALTTKSKASQNPTTKTDPNLALSEQDQQALRKRQKYVIFLCDKRRRCGGWGDRQRGLLGVYMLALVTGRRFGLNMTVPCNVTNFFHPNKYNWIVHESELVNRTSIVLDDVNSRLSITGRLSKMNFDAEYPQDVVYIRTNAEYWLGIRINPRYSLRMPQWAKGSKAQYFREGWNWLMTPQPSLQGRIDGFLQRIDFDHRTHPLVCAHVRVGRSQTGVKTDTMVRTNLTDLPILWNFVEKNWILNGSNLFIATDDVQVRNLTNQRFKGKVYDSGGAIVHIDQGGGLPDVCGGFEFALLDQHILSVCDVLITGYSIFSQRASYMRARPDDLYSFVLGKITKISV